MNLRTEQENPLSRDLDLMPVSKILEVLNQEDHVPAAAVRRALSDIELVVSFIVKHHQLGGRMLYIGAGTSGRIGLMDAAECPPTFGVDASCVTAVMAGGLQAAFCAAEGLEDRAEDGVRAVDDWLAKPDDCVIGLAASGRTPYVIAGLAQARARGAYTALICSSAPIGDAADVIILLDTGPEALTGSTRLKAGTAAKMALNMISTAAMIKLGRTYGNRMCYIRAGNEKLRSRAVDTIMAVCGTDEPSARTLLGQAEDELAVALTMGLSGAKSCAAREALRSNGGRVRDAVLELLRTDIRDE